MFLVLCIPFPVTFTFYSVRTLFRTILVPSLQVREQLSADGTRVYLLSLCVMEGILALVRTIPSASLPCVDVLATVRALEVPWLDVAFYMMVQFFQVCMHVVTRV